MSEMERFGNYLLLKRLEEDGLGESFRAARVGGQGIEQVVLLRVFNAEGIGRDTLTHLAATRSDLRSRLGGPGTGSEVDMGAVAGTPYVAYDYVSGRSLSTVLQQAKSERFPLPVDHALLIAERLAQGLASAEELRLDDQKVVHGFVVPPLIYLSTEGDVRALGFEMGPGLRQFAASGPLRASFGSYLAPEALSGEPLHASESAWSLGAILFEMLTGAPPWPDRPIQEQLEQATLASEGTPLSADIVALLQRSLAPKGERIADAATWHREVTRVMTEGDYSPTTFNLAFFMHSLLRDEIERETEEREAEESLAITASATRPATPTAAPSPAPGSSTPEEETPPESEESLERTETKEWMKPSDSGSMKGLWVGIAAVIVVLAGAGGGYYYYLGQHSDASGGSTQNATETSQPTANGQGLNPGADSTTATNGTGAAAGNAAATPESPSPEELEAKMKDLIDQRYKVVEDNLQSQYDAKLKDLQKELDAAKKRAADREAALAAERQRQQEEAARKAEEARLAEQKKQEEAAAAAAEQQAANKDANKTANGTNAAAPVEVKKPEPPKAKRGDLVDLSDSGVTPPQRTASPPLRYPPMAQRLGRQATVEVRVLVDESGLPAKVELAGPKAGLGFDDAALELVRGMRWKPAVKDSVPVKVWLQVTVDFHL